jgi:hypothetical protein
MTLRLHSADSDPSDPSLKSRLTSYGESDSEAVTGPGPAPPDPGPTPRSGPEEAAEESVAAACGSLKVATCGSDSAVWPGPASEIVPSRPGGHGLTELPSHWRCVATLSL